MNVRPPISFQGQKCGFRVSFCGHLEQTYDETFTFVDLFGGSGLLSHYAHNVFPNATVIYNDYDNYVERVKNIDKTNKIIDWLEAYMICHDIPPNGKLTPEQQGDVMAYIKYLIEKGEYVDLLTISKEICWTNKPVRKYDELYHRLLYNNVSKKRRSYDSHFYDGITVVNKDFRDLYDLYKNKDKIVFIVDPPYLYSPSLTYRSNFNMQDYVSTLDIFVNENHVIYFCNGDMYELIKWSFSKIPGLGYIKANSLLRKTSSWNGGYVDVMLIKNTSCSSSSEVSKEIPQ